MNDEMREAEEVGAGVLVKPQKKHHFVVMSWETEDGTIQWELESDQDAYLSDGSLWDEHEQEWLVVSEDADIERDSRMVVELSKNLLDRNASAT